MQNKIRKWRAVIEGTIEDCDTSDLNEGQTHVGECYSQIKGELEFINIEGADIHDVKLEILDKD